MITKIISGGQTGADQGGLKAAKRYGIETGGHCPKGGLTEDGNNQNLMKVFGLIETTSDKYPARTFENAKNSDGTIRFAHDFNSRGELLTLKAINQYNKPHIDVNVSANHQTTPKMVADWIINNKISVLNVAGNRESTCEGLEQFVIEFLREVISLTNYGN